MSKIIVLRILKDVERPVLLDGEHLTILCEGEVVGTTNGSLANALIKQGYAIKDKAVPA